VPQETGFDRCMQLTMTSRKSPGAGDALEASAIDQRDQQVDSKFNSRKPVSQAPIIALISGSDRCDAEGMTVRSRSPLLAMCRALVAAGYERSRPLHAYRGDVLACLVRNIGEGASLAVDDEGFVASRLTMMRIMARRPKAMTVVA
jgi:hypothetical protein